MNMRRVALTRETIERRRGNGCSFDTGPDAIGAHTTRALAPVVEPVEPCDHGNCATGCCTKSGSG
jgi:hypothetical protein